MRVASVASLDNRRVEPSTMLFIRIHRFQKRPKPVGPKSELPLVGPVGQSEAATAQSSSALAASLQANPLSTTSVAPASR